MKFYINNKEILNHLNVNFIEYKDEVNDYDVLNLSKKYALFKKNVAN